MPSYTKNYYRILGLDAPIYGSNQLDASSANVKKAYRQALLAAHPDKNGAREGGEENSGHKGGYTVDDVKEAWNVLGNQQRREEYEAWFRTRRSVGGEDIEKAGEADADFVLGLEVLDLADFEEMQRPPSSFTASPSSSSATSRSSSGSTSPHQDSQQVGEEETQWTRSCRCGAAQGFRISETDLEKALERGEAEVLVGCEGCSLWVRVGFGVEGE